LKKLTPQTLQKFEAEIGETPDDLFNRARTQSPTEFANWARSLPSLGPLLDWGPESNGGRILPISPHEDEVTGIARGYGDADRPEDFLDSFAAFVRNNLNKIAALNVVVTRPRDLTREQLRELKLALDREHYSEINLQQAWKQAKNEDIAASIIGFIRQAALREPLMAYGDRVSRAIATILKSRNWTAAGQPDRERLPPPRG
jgi:type I restriction enzyme, R subunit